MGNICPAQTPQQGSEQIVEEDLRLTDSTEAFEIWEAPALFTGAAGLVNAARIKVQNKSDLSIMILNSGDTFSLATTQMEASVNFSGGVGAGGSKQQLGNESKLAKTIVVPGGERQINFHGDQAKNYISICFIKDNNWHFVEKDRITISGSKIIVTTYPANEASIIEVTNNQGQPLNSTNAIKEKVKGKGKEGATEAKGAEQKEMELAAKQKEMEMELKLKEMDMEFARKQKEMELAAKQKEMELAAKQKEMELEANAKKQEEKKTTGNIEGKWVPANHGAWWADALGSHKQRAQDPSTHMKISGDHLTLSCAGLCLREGDLTQIADGSYDIRWSYRTSEPMVGKFHDCKDGNGTWKLTMTYEWGCQECMRQFFRHA